MTEGERKNKLTQQYLLERSNLVLNVEYIQCFYTLYIILVHTYISVKYNHIYMSSSLQLKRHASVHDLGAKLYLL